MSTPDDARYLKDEAAYLAHVRPPLGPARALIERAGLPCTVHIGVGDFAHVIAHYANTLGATEVIVTETERAEGSALGEAVAAMTGHTQVPVAIGYCVRYLVR